MSFHRIDGTSIEVFWRGAHCDDHPNGNASCHECAMNSGWFWWACFPGCMPDGEACGPFASEDEALENAHG